MNSPEGPRSPLLGVFAIEPPTSYYVNGYADEPESHFPGPYEIPAELLDSQTLLTGAGQMDLPRLKVPRLSLWLVLVWLLPHLIYLVAYLIQIVYAVYLLVTFQSSSLVIYNLLHGLLGAGISLVRLDTGRPISWVITRWGHRTPLLLGFIVDALMYGLVLISTNVILFQPSSWLDHSLLIFTAVNLMLSYSRIGISLFIVRLLMVFRPKLLHFIH